MLAKFLAKFPIVLFHSLVVKSNILCNNSSILVAISIQVFINFPTQYCFYSEIQCLLQQFHHSGCKYYSSLSTFSTVFCHSFLKKSNTFLYQLIPALFPFNFFHFDSKELSREPVRLHNPIRSLILRVILIWKQFNFSARPHAYILYVSCEIQKSPQQTFINYI